MRESGPLYLDSAGVLPRDLGAVPRVRAGDGAGALGPGGGVVELSHGVTSHQGGGGRLALVGGALLHIVVVFTGVGDVLGDVGQAVVPSKVVVSSVRVWIILGADC